MRSIIRWSAAAIVCCLGFAGSARAAEVLYRPYILARQEPGVLEEKVGAIRRALEASGLQIAGEYAFSETAQVFVVTNDDLKTAATRGTFGGYGAALRVAVTKVGDQVQVSYTNPLWMADVYRMGADASAVAAQLETALGKTQEFGSKDGLTAKQLRSYHYMMMMPYFTDQVVLAEYADHQQALEKVEKGLAGSSGVKKIARIDVPGAEATLFCVAILAGDGADATVMKATDTGALRHTAHLPYELLVSGKKAYMLHGKFRIAQSFPDLTMGTFMKISGAPDGIEKALKAALR